MNRPYIYTHIYMGFPGSSDGKESACSVGGVGSTPESGRSPGKGNGYPLQYSCLENSKERGAWWATVRGVAESQIRRSNFHFHIYTYTHAYTHTYTHACNSLLDFLHIQVTTEH